MGRRRFLFGAWVVSLIATATSLYWSDILGWLPCDLCWYERICMYPLVVILGIGVFARKSDTFRIAITFPIVGLFISAYHYLMQIMPGVARTASCSSAVPCQIPDFVWFGWITPPLLAFLGFLCIGVCLALYRRSAAAASVYR
ncbi:disulfide bond formation protein B [Alicyclobacillus cycloheptanicus]|uniref:Disulfide bond formation protein DsbB n=1 Tax=Alicyclobacillus cycloheptanicus TaxID=1457 RepID=A0ABT9XME6_9BACL|nr:disulfide bond formation protein B [Alicyclobacillus cycloheptanicus]MDQ0191489.1 disulfide bond formation protein DsbB [Alicyclobacillus cycloheptanicus]WDM01895.1 disulfide bond formation protein B [Alicyclobacillus cycloheptanicus]